MKKAAIGLAAVLLIVVSLYALWVRHRGIWEKPGSTFKVYIVSVVEIDPITQLRQGFKEAFLGSTFAKSRKVDVQEFNAQGDPGLINQIADKVVAERPDLVYVLGTPVAQAIQKRSPDLLLVQGAVTDPVEAGLADSWNGSGRKYIATSDLPPMQKQVELIKELVPNVRRLGVIYNPGETNSVAVVSRLKTQIKNLGLGWQVVERPVGSTAEVATTIQTFLGKIDALYLPPDNTAHAAIPVIGRFARENKIPLFATVSNALDDGALATLALDFKQVGRDSADLALAVLGGQDPATTPIRVNGNPLVTISKQAASGLGLDISRFEGRPNVMIK